MNFTPLSLSFQTAAEQPEPQKEVVVLWSQVAVVESIVDAHDESATGTIMLKNGTRYVVSPYVASHVQQYFEWYLADREQERQMRESYAL